MRASRMSTVAALVLAGTLLAPSLAQGALRADEVRIAKNPSLVRIVVQFSGGPPLTGLERQTDALDPEPLDGRAIVRINAAGIRTVAAPQTKFGVTATVIQRPGNLLVRTTAQPGTLKFVSYRVSIPRKVLIIDLWRVTTQPAARRLSDGCLRMTSWSGRAGRARARGRELQPLFEHGLVLTLRGPDGAPIAEKPLTATEGVFKPDFSGYLVPGRWAGSMAVPPAGHGVRAMLEAWSSSAKDGSLDCLVQTPVIVRA